MLFNSGEFLIFFPIVVLVYFIIPDKIKYLWLLAASYYFYMGWNAKYALLLLFSTVVTYISGILLDKEKKKSVVAMSFILNLGILFFFKYSNFAGDLLNSFFYRTHLGVTVPKFDILLPVGISFYTFQALSYTVDVYRGEIYAERNFFRYALYVSFFPQLVAGPIERSKNLLKQLAVPTRFDYERARDGFWLMLWGYFLKIVLADRIAIVVDTIFANYESYTGFYVIVATLLFAIQMYCDFAGYSTIAIGAAQILGIKLMDNFRSPYTAGSIAEFWQRWHISLTTWFRDYLYFPLGGSRKGKVRKMINIMIIFMVSGLWHGAAMHYVVWGGIHGMYQVVGELVAPARKKLVEFLRLNSESLGFKIYRAIGTFLLLAVTHIFFRADSLKTAVSMYNSMIRANNPWILFDGSLYNLGIAATDFRFMLIGIAVLIAVDIINRNNIRIRDKLAAQDYPVRWLVTAGAIVLILTFGIWGANYNSANFMYFQF